MMWRTRISFSALLAFALFGFSSASSWATSNYPASAKFSASALADTYFFATLEQELITRQSAYYPNVTIGSVTGSSSAVPGSGYMNWQTNGTPGGSWAWWSAYGCPYGGTLSGSTCLNGTPPPKCPGGTEFISCGSVSGVSSCGSTDANGCSVSPAPGVCFGQNGVWMCPVTQAGGYAGTPPAGVTNVGAQPGPCPAGTSSGTVNGVAVCAGPGGTSPAPPLPASSPGNPCSGGLVAGTINGQSVCVAGPQTTQGVSNTTVTVNGGTTNITTTQTSCTGANCTTVTGPAKSSSAPPGSASGAVSSTTQPKSTFCSQNPTSPLCASTGTVTGSCTSGFSGTDNSPETVSAVALANLDCSAPASGVPVGPFGPSAAVASNPAQGSVDAGPPAPSSAGACPIAAQTLTIGQMSATVDLTSMCAYFATFRAVLIAFASVMWFLVIGRWRG